MLNHSGRIHLELAGSSKTRIGSVKVPREVDAFEYKADISTLIRRKELVVIAVPARGDDSGRRFEIGMKEHAYRIPLLRSACFRDFGDKVIELKPNQTLEDALEDEVNKKYNNTIWQRMLLRKQPAAKKANNIVAGSG